MMDLSLKDLEILSEKSKLVYKFMSNLEELNEDPVFREYMTVEEDQRKIYNSEMSYARRTGLEEGRAEGRAEGITEGAKQKSIEIARSLLSLGVNTLEQIAEVTKLSVEEIQALKEE